MTELMLLLKNGLTENQIIRFSANNQKLQSRDQWNIPSFFFNLVLILRTILRKEPRVVGLDIPFLLIQGNVFKILLLIAHQQHMARFEKLWNIPFSLRI